jgi:hypothetical protein
VNERVSYWLIPAEPDGEHFLEIICEMAGWFHETPVFNPHVTVYSGPLDPRDDVETILAAAAVGIAEVTLRARGIGRSEEFTKSLFVEFESSSVVTQISDRLKNGSATPADYKLGPHLSLIYARLSNEMKDQLTRGLSLPPTVRFDALQAVRTGPVTESKSDVEAWRVLATRRLHSA